jgi:uncharacterized protein
MLPIKPVTYTPYNNPFVPVRPTIADQNPGRPLLHVLPRDTVLFGAAGAIPQSEVLTGGRRIWDSIKSAFRNLGSMMTTAVTGWMPHIRNIGRSIHSAYEGVKFVAALVVASTVPIPAVRNYIERQYLYDPPIIVSKDDIKNPTLRGKIKDHYFSSTDGTRLHGWYVPAEDPTKPTIVFAHGKSSNIGYYETVLDYFNKHKYGMFLFDYRGFGNSGGKPSEEGLSKDLEAASDFIADYPDPKYRVPVGKQVAMGYSLGGGPTADVATRRDFRAVILCSTYTSMNDALLYHKNRYNPYVRWLLNEKIVTSKFDSLSKVPQIKSPLLVVHGTKDAVIPVEMGEKLYNKATTPHKHFLKIDDSDHYNMCECGGDKLVNSLEQVMRSAEDRGEAKVA